MALPTSRGGALLCFVAALYVAARLLGTWELYLLAVAFLWVLLLCWLMVLAAARGLEADRSLTPAHPVAGDRVVFAVRVRNRSWSPGVQVTVEHAAGLGSTDGRVAFASLGPRSQATATTVVEPARRGLHHLPPMALLAEDPLGLVCARRRVGAPLDVTVFPRLVELRSCALLADLGTRGRQGTRGAAGPGTSELRSIRPFQPGEPLSRVDWKSTAKTGTLMVRETGDPAGGDVTLLLEGTATRVSGRPPDTNYELALTALGSAADLALRTGRAVDLLLHEARWHRLHLAADADGRRRLLEALSIAAPDAGSSLAEALRRSAGERERLFATQYLVVAALGLDEELADAVADVQAQGVSIAAVVVAPASSTAGAGAHRLTEEQRRTLIELAARGILCLHVSAADDLRSALATRRAARAAFAAR
jgi:uncharacterized protein (DUF58 family)